MIAISCMLSNIIFMESTSSVIGHHEEKTLQRFNRTLQLQQFAAQALYTDPYDGDSNPLTYEDR